ncbi:hypothetical protein PspLS_06479 [Pyricularia sp. CBS 133598]|nr:hypothetical protein PspLS_06479 [Pyricularia sp. CBS 133598]
MPNISIAFDLYGTLLSTDAISDQVAEMCGDETKAKQITSLWRRYQLEYSWRITAMGIYRPFPDITEAALKHAAAEAGVPLSAEAVAALQRSYSALSVYGDVEQGLRQLQSERREGGRDVRCFIFSNGTAAAVDASVASSPTLSRYADVFEKPPLSVEAVGAFKPAAAVYDHLVAAATAGGDGGGDGAVGVDDVWLVTANPFDVVGARASGVKVVWIDRAGTGWIDRLGEVIGTDIGPTHVEAGVHEAVLRILYSYV